MKWLLNTSSQIPERENPAAVKRDVFVEESDVNRPKRYLKLEKYGGGVEHKKPWSGWQRKVAHKICKVEYNKWKIKVIVSKTGEW